jgi:hypothetical protein
MGRLEEESFTKRAPPRDTGPRKETVGLPWWGNHNDSEIPKQGDSGAHEQKPRPRMLTAGASVPFGEDLLSSNSSNAALWEMFRVQKERKLRRWLGDNLPLARLTKLH